MSGLVKAFQQRVDPLDGDDGIHADPKFAFPAGGNPLNASLQFAGGAQQVAAIVEQGLSGRIQAGLAPLAGKERNPQFVFELGDGVG